MTGDENWERVVMDMTYWKATRLNGTDFYTGTVDWDGNFYAFCPECFETLDGAE